MAGFLIIVMMNEYKIRLATVDDADSILNVYTPYVLQTASTFEYDVPSVEEFRNRVAKISAQYPYLVCEYDGEIVGYAYGSTHRERMGYSWCAEATVYLSEAHHRRGIARILYDALFALMKEQGYKSIYVSILSTNVASLAFHRAMGFEDIGMFRNIGYKLGDWHSNIWMQLFLDEHHAAPPLPVAFIAIDEGLTEEVMAQANKRVKMVTSYHGNEIQLRELP
jgi:L-amino acid N-acyltransferase YncA